VFTGLIADLGKVVRFERSQLVVETHWRDVKRGESIAIDGVCLTVEKKQGKHMFFTVGPETRRLTTLGVFRPGRAVNLERALRVGDALGGHWVSGHVEGTALVVQVRREAKSWWLRLAIPKPLSRFVVPKGSIAVDGVSLTVANQRGVHVDLMIIPHTLTHTTLQFKRAGDQLNIETDLLAKYAMRGKN
jgi:riboflavin synthase